MNAPLSHVPVFHTYVDFTDSTFIYANSTEISADIESMNINGRGKNLLKQEAQACVFTAILKNNTNKYTPTYTSSPVYPNQAPGKLLWSMMGYPADQFSGLSNGSTLSGRTPDHDATFAAWSGHPTSWQMSASGLSTTVAGNSAVLDFGESNCHVGALITAPTWGSNVGPGIVFRFTDDNNYWLAFPLSGAINVYKMVTGSLHLAGSASVTWPSGSSHWLLAELTGFTIRIFMDDQCVMAPIVDNFNSTATKHGTGSMGGQTIAGYITEAGGYRPVFSGRTDSWTPNLDPTVNQCTVTAQ